MTNWQQHQSTTSLLTPTDISVKIIGNYCNKNVKVGARPYPQSNTLKMKELSSGHAEMWIQNGLAKIKNRHRHHGHGVHGMGKQSRPLLQASGAKAHHLSQSCRVFQIQLMARWVTHVLQSPYKKKFYRSGLRSQKYNEDVGDRTAELKK